MKRLLLFFACVFVFAVAWSQAPQAFTYQMVVRGADGNAVQNRTVSIITSFLQGSPAGEVRYSEQHQPVTDANGLVSIAVGQGYPLMGNSLAAGVEWADGPWFLQTKIDPEGGINYCLTTVQQLLSVPYALYAERTGDIAFDGSRLADSILTVMQEYVDGVMTGSVVHDTVVVHDSIVVHVHDSVVVHVYDSIIVHVYDSLPDDPQNPSVGGFDQNGASNAVFTVASGRTVKFSRGNLQYQASTGIWRFAEHQYDIVGSTNSNISSSNSGWIDLFGWGTSGWHSGANVYQPWATSTTYSDYYPGGSYNNNLTGAYANADWGVYNCISNGGNQAGMWRTLTKDEWSYLLNSRAASTINGEANARYAKAVVNGTNGVVLFPDNFTMPSGMSYPSGINSSSTTFSGNTYTESQWSQMEGAGAIFLPAAGRRSGTEVRDVGTYGRYWSSTFSGEYDAYRMNFYGNGLDVLNSYRIYGHSVRLVKD